MHHEKMVVAIKTNGKVLREQGDVVYLPFGSEYQIHIKNLNSVRALVKVSIDGQDTMENVSGVIVPANGTVDLERFIKQGNLDQGNRFKFIERTEKIENGPRGIRAEDGLIRVEFEYERVSMFASTAQLLKQNWNDTVYDAHNWNNMACSTNAAISGITPRATKGMSAAPINSDDGHLGVPCSAALNDIGITVPGSVSDQKFTMTSGFISGGFKKVIVMKLIGEVAGKAVKKPVTVKTKQKCETCGHMNKWGSKFCSECGTSLQIV
jgi:hypothetical protein